MVENSSEFISLFLHHLFLTPCEDRSCVLLLSLLCSIFKAQGTKELQNGNVADAYKLSSSSLPFSTYDCDYSFSWPWVDHVRYSYNWINQGHIMCIIPKAIASLCVVPCYNAFYWHINSYIPKCTAIGTWLYSALITLDPWPMLGIRSEHAEDCPIMSFWHNFAVNFKIGMPEILPFKIC